uniref:Uncharacterized protein n=1 Tax=Vespula pensylvanica TaxID=30213 RepID=A0A834KCI9_VESPE|nr:hypothetical protein H0235_014877 [Vespula pensylvanica]
MVVETLNFKQQYQRNHFSNVLVFTSARPNCAFSTSDLLHPIFSPLNLGVYRKIDTSGNASRLNNIFRLEELKVANRFSDKVQPILHTQLELSYEPISLDVSGYRIWS